MTYYTSRGARATVCARAFTGARAARTALVLAVLDRALPAPLWRSVPGLHGGADWHHERRDARVSARPGVLVVWISGARVAYVENPTPARATAALRGAGLLR